jgi:5'-3' exonuclease
MGVNNLTAFLKKKSLRSYTEMKLSNMKGKRVAVDVSVYLYQFKSISAPILGSTKFRMGKYIDLFANFCICLVNNGISPVFVFDGPSPPEKKEEQTRRGSRRDIVKGKIDSLEKIVENLECKSITLQEGVDSYNLITAKSRDGKLPIYPTLNQIIKAIQYKAHKLKNQTISVTFDDSDLIRELLGYLGLQYINAPGEADAMCAYMALNDHADAVLSDDNDFLPYGVKTIMSKIDLRKNACTLVSYDHILEDLAYTPDQFLDFCIMCGTDYNSNVLKVGPVKSHKYITDHKSIEDVIENTPITEEMASILKHCRVREMYREFPYITEEQCNEIDVKLISLTCQDVEWDKLKEYLFKHNCMYNERIIRRELGFPGLKLI